jgi:ATP-binding cassette subfamily B protein
MQKSEADNRDTGILADMVTNIIAVKSFATEQAEKSLFKKSTDHSKQLLDKAGKAVFVRDMSVATITTGFQIAAIIVAITAIVDNKADLALVFLILSYADTLVDQLWFFGTATITNFDRCMGDAREGVLTLLTKPKITDASDPLPFASIRGDIVFKSVTFSHSDSDDAALFKKLNIHIKPGEKIGLVGHSGGGKSTLTKLIMRLMDIDKGHILIDGQDISKVRQNDLRKYVSYVPQEPIMFHRSLAENIAYGAPVASQQEIEAAAKMANAHDFIISLPEGYDTLVGERGVKLSGGQRQRVAIARAMLKNAPILLLDEATSALDSESESLIQDALWKLIKHKTAIVIAHRLSTIQKMDRILVLENGEVVEEGSHNELIKNDGIYAELWSHQSGGFIEE